jgi:hypothetical protein
MTDSQRLPARPSFEQLQKQAKELLRLYRADDGAAVGRFRAVTPQLLDSTARPVALADAQFVLAREYGFESWAKLKYHVAAMQPTGLEEFERLAKDLADAYSTGNATAIRELNWNRGTAFVHDREPTKMQQRLTAWFASETRTPDLALSDAQRLVARSYGFESWAGFADSVRKAAGSRPSPAHTPPFYRIDWKENSVSVRGLLSEENWDTVCFVMREHQITRLQAGGITDAGLGRVSRLEHIIDLQLGNSSFLTDAGLEHLSRMPQLQSLDLGGPRGAITDRGLQVLQNLRDLRRLHLYWQQNISDAGMAHLAALDKLESVDLMGTPAGDAAIRALAGKSQLRSLKTGRNVTDAGLALLHEIPVFKTWQGDDVRYDLMAFEAKPNHLLLDGPFTNAGLESLSGLDGLFGLTFFWHCPVFTSDGLASLKQLDNLGFLGCQDQHCDDEAMRHIAAIPRLRMLMGQGAVAGDAGFEALSRSQTIEYIWGRECPNFTGRGFAALAAMPALRGLGVSCRNVDDEALAMLPRFPALRQLMPMGVSDDGFRHVGRCEQLENLRCMYCRDTGDTATGHIAGLPKLKTYYAGQTKITDRSLEILARMQSLERLEFWDCAGITNAGVAHLASLPRLREITLEVPGVTHEVAELFAAHVHVKF